MSGDGKVLELGPEDFAEVVASRVRRDFQMSVEEFLAAFESGQLGDEPGVMELAVLLGANSR